LIFQGDANGMNLADNGNTRSKINFLFDKLGLDPKFSSQFADKLLAEGNTNENGLLDATGMLCIL